MFYRIEKEQVDKNRNINFAEKFIKNQACFILLV